MLLAPLFGEGAFYSDYLPCVEKSHEFAIVAGLDYFEVRMGKQVGISVDIVNDKVLIQFGRDVNHIEFTPQQAMEYIDAIYSKVRDLDKSKSSIIITPSL